MTRTPNLGRFRHNPWKNILRPFNDRGCSVTKYSDWRREITVGDLFGAHSQEGIIGGLCNLSPSSCPSAPPPPPVPAAPFSWQSPSPTTFTPSGSLTAIPPPTSHPAPGGISLSKAAAAQMPLNIALDGAYYKDGRLVLSGRSDGEYGFDAALLRHALSCRTCEPTDPYFSLDPLDVKAWNADGQSASEDLWRHIVKD